MWLELKVRVVRHRELLARRVSDRSVGCVMVLLCLEPLLELLALQSHIHHSWVLVLVVVQDMVFLDGGGVSVGVASAVARGRGAVSGHWTAFVHHAGVLFERWRI